MKHLFLFVIFCVVVITGITSCSTKFSIAAPYKNITVVYGLLDEGDTAHYIRIQKAFLSQSLSAYDIAKVSDSSYFPQLNVVLKAYNSGSMVGSPIVLTRVDLNQEGYPKDSGTFSNTPNYAYKFKGALNPANTYRLVITNPSTGDVDSAETNIIDESPANFSCPPLDIPGGVADLDFTHYNGTFEIDGHVPATVAYVQGILRVRWVDKNSQTNTATERSADWIFSTLVPAGNGGGGSSNGYNLKANNRDFYGFLETAMKPAPQYVTRLMDSAYLYLYAANGDFYQYMLITQTLGTGLTGMDIEPNYTNIKGPLGATLGLYAGRGLRTGPVRYVPLTIDSLMAFPALSNLNIVGTAYN